MTSASIGNNILLKKLLGSGFAALVLKVLSAAFAYLMFVAIGRGLGVESFGIFAAAFSVALVLGKIGLAGQEWLMVRFLPRYENATDMPLLSGAIRFGYGVTILLSIAASLLLALYTTVFVDRQDALYNALLATCLLVPFLALADVQSGIQRAGGSVIGALAPRDFIWRASITFGAFAVAYYWPNTFGAAQTLLACAGALALLLVIQALWHPLTRPWGIAAKPAQYKAREWISTAAPFWVSNVVTFNAPNIAVVVLAAVLTPEASGPFFAAIKTAQLMSLLLVASEIVSAPLISKYYAEGDKEKVQLICAAISWISFAFSAATFLFMIFAGKMLLNFFGPGFDGVYYELLVIAGGFIIHAACGTNNVLLNMTAHGKMAMVISFTVNAFGLLLLAATTIFGGSMGAAITLAGITCTWNIWMVIYARRKLGIDPSILSLPTLFQKAA